MGSYRPGHPGFPICQISSRHRAQPNRASQAKTAFWAVIRARLSALAARRDADPVPDASGETIPARFRPGCINQAFKSRKRTCETHKTLRRICRKRKTGAFHIGYVAYIYVCVATVGSPCFPPPRAASSAIVGVVDYTGVRKLESVSRLYSLQTQAFTWPWTSETSRRNAKTAARRAGSLSRTETVDSRRLNSYHASLFIWPPAIWEASGKFTNLRRWKNERNSKVVLGYNRDCCDRRIVHAACGKGRTSEGRSPTVSEDLRSRHLRWRQDLSESVRGR